MRLKITQGRVLDPASKTDGIYDILVEDGRIVKLDTQIEEEADQVIDAVKSGAISHRLFPLRFTLYPAFSQLCPRKSATSPSSLLKEGREIIPFNRSIAS